MIIYNNKQDNNKIIYVTDLREICNRWFDEKKSGEKQCYILKETTRKSTKVGNKDIRYFELVKVWSVEGKVERERLFAYKETDKKSQIEISKNINQYIRDVVIVVNKIEVESILYEDEDEFTNDLMILFIAEGKVVDYTIYRNLESCSIPNCFMRDYQDFKEEFEKRNKGKLKYYFVRE